MLLQKKSIVYTIQYWSQKLKSSEKTIIATKKILEKKRKKRFAEKKIKNPVKWNSWAEKKDPPEKTLIDGHLYPAVWLGLKKRLTEFFHTTTTLKLIKAHNDNKQKQKTIHKNANLCK